MYEAGSFIKSFHEGALARPLSSVVAARCQLVNQSGLNMNMLVKRAIRRELK